MIEFDIPSEKYPEIILFAKGGRQTRYEEIIRGSEVPREFFYGFFSIIAEGFNVAFMSVSGKPNKIIDKIFNLIERLLTRITGVGSRPLSLYSDLRRISKAKLLISCVDGFSLTLGLGFVPKNIFCIGGFQGFGDIITNAPVLMRPITRYLLSRALKNLDHVFFLSPADRLTAIQNFGIKEIKTTLIPFCIDTDFWRPDESLSHENWVFSIGQDRNRDFQTLIQAPGSHEIRIHTSLDITLDNLPQNVMVSNGGFSAEGRISDVQLRQLYQRSLCVVVPLKDVFQPSGQSVTLQAMSCGKPVILTKTRGLWDCENLIDGKNCILVSPSNPDEIASAIVKLKSDRIFYNKISNAARETAVKNFPLSRMDNEFIRLVHLGLRSDH